MPQYTFLAAGVFGYIYSGRLVSPCNSYSLFSGASREMAGDATRLEQISVTNVSAVLREKEWLPEYVFSTKGAADVLKGQRYVVA